MAQFVTNRPRMSDPTSKKTKGRTQRFWETLKVICYEVGGLAFALSSIFFFSAMSEYKVVGQSLALSGAVIYFWVTFNDFIEVIRYWHYNKTKGQTNYMEYTTSGLYACGTLLFVIGNCVSLPFIDHTEAGAWLYITGAALYVFSGLVNVLQIVEAPSLISLQLFNFTLVFFILGSTLFFVSTIPYLWSLSGSAANDFKNLSAGQYLAGSLFFIFGGMGVSIKKSLNNEIGHYRTTSLLERLFLKGLRNEIKEKGNLSDFLQSLKDDSKADQDEED